MSDMLGVPEHWPKRYNASSDACDMIQGPCACGAWHNVEEDWVKDFCERFGMTTAHLPVKLVILDIDGTLTDGGYYVSEAGVAKKYNTRDFVGMYMLHQIGVKFGVITGEKNRDLVIHRFAMAASYIPEEDVYTNAIDKLSAAEELVGRHKLQWSDVAFIGDELNDLELLGVVGYPGCPYDAALQVRELVDGCKDGFVSVCKGGDGAVRDFCESILSMSGFQPFWRLK